MEKVSRERWVDSADRRHMVRVASLRRLHLSKALKSIPCILYSHTQHLLIINIWSYRYVAHLRLKTSGTLFLTEGLLPIREKQKIL